MVGCNSLFRGWCERGILLCLTFTLVVGCNRVPQEIALSGPTMGTTYLVKVVAPPAGVDSQRVLTSVEETLAQIDREMSGYRTDSAISQFNASTETEWVAAPTGLARVVAVALEVSERSGGAFDVTVAPLVKSWGFGAAGDPVDLPDDVALAALRRRVGYQKLHARSVPPALRKDVADLTVDLNGIAPGFAVDAVAQRLAAMHIDNFMIDIGGEVRARGRNARGQPWRIAVERPIDAEEPRPYAIVQLDDLAVTTSGEYRRFHVREGRRYSHTIDPRSARPVDHALASVVVIGADAAHVDAWATAYNVLGEDAGFALATKLNMPVMFIVQRGDELERRMTPQFEGYLVEESDEDKPQRTPR